MKRVLGITVVLLSFFHAYGSVRCVDTDGEAIIVRNDIPSAKAEALARAKWNAVEQVGGVRVKAQTVVQNMALVDEMVTKQVKGLVVGHSVKRAWQEGEIYKVIANVCVEPSKVEDALSLLSLNNSVAVLILAKKPKQTPGSKEEYEETNILSETIIGRLAEKDVKVVDITPTHLVDAQLVEQAIRTGNFIHLRSFMYKSLSSLLLIGKIDYTISTRRGQDVGYGVAMPFDRVTTRLTYRLVAKEEGTGRIIILAAGAEEGKGMAPNLEDAVARSMQELTEKFTPMIIDRLSKYLQGLTKKVRINVVDVKDLSKSLEIKELIQHTSWVTDVEVKGPGEFIVGYPENTVYLANSLSQKGFEVVDFSSYSLTLRYKAY